MKTVTFLNSEFEGKGFKNFLQSDGWICWGAKSRNERWFFLTQRIHEDFLPIFFYHNGYKKEILIVTDEDPTLIM